MVQADLPADSAEQPEQAPVAETVAEPVAEVVAEEVVAEEPVAEVVEEPVVEVAEPVEEPVVEPVEEAPVEVVEEVKADEVVEVVEAPVAEVVAEAEQEVVAAESKPKLNIPAGKKLTFAEKMCQADEENQAIYNLLKNELMSYKKVSNRRTKVIDIFKYKSTYLAKVGLTGKTVKLHLALDPNEYAVTKYHHKDLGEKKKYEFVPLELKVKSPRSQKYAIELIAGVMERAGLVKNPKYQQVDYIDAMKQEQVSSQEQAEQAE